MAPECMVSVLEAIVAGLNIYMLCLAKFTLGFM